MTRVQRDRDPWLWPWSKRIPMTRVQFKDKGHLARKAVWLSYAFLAFLPYMAGKLAGELADGLIAFGGRLHRWAHPCLYWKPPR